MSSSPRCSLHDCRSTLDAFECAGTEENRSSLIALLLAGGLASGTATAATDVANWIGTTGNWNTAANWSGNVIPQNVGAVTFEVHIDNGDSGTVNILGQGVSTTTTTLDAVTTDGSVIQGNNSDAVVVNGLTNNGTWQVNSIGTNTDVRFNGGQTFGGSGSMVLSDNLGNQISSDGTTLAQGANHTISGAGKLLNNTGCLLNQGTVTANRATAMTVDPGAGQSLENQGAIEARDGGTLTIVDSTEVANVFGNTLTGGSWNVVQGAGGITTLNLGTGANTADITTNNATILRSGTNAVFNGIANLATNQGSFTIEQDADFNTVGGFGNSGTVVINVDLGMVAHLLHGGLANVDVSQPRLLGGTDLLTVHRCPPPVRLPLASAAPSMPCPPRSQEPDRVSVAPSADGIAALSWAAVFRIG